MFWDNRFWSLWTTSNVNKHTLYCDWQKIQSWTSVLKAFWLLSYLFSFPQSLFLLSRFLLITCNQSDVQDAWRLAKYLLETGFCWDFSLFVSAVLSARWLRWSLIEKSLKSSIKCKANSRIRPEMSRQKSTPVLHLLLIPITSHGNSITSRGLNNF